MANWRRARQQAMRVLAICEYASLNGGERSFLEAARHFDASQIELLVAAPAVGPMAVALSTLAATHIPFDVTSVPDCRPSQADLRRQLTDLISRVGADLVHANSLSMSRLLGPVAHTLSVPSVGHLRDVMRISRRAIDDLNQLSCLLAVSHATARWYTGLGVAPERLHVLHNGVDVHRFHPGAATGVLHRELGIEPATPLVGSVGQIGMRKGVDTFVEAARQIAGTRADVHFVHVGRRYSRKAEAIAYEQAMRRLADMAPLTGRFHFLGVRSDVHSILNELTLYVHAARQEPLGRVLLEAGASGLPIVATAVGGTSEIFPVCCAAAILVPENSPAALTRAVSRLLETPDERRQLGQNARRRIVATFSGPYASRKLQYWYRSTCCGDV